ncbi:MAG: hypothetical protein U9Q03_03225 [Patescibacteria group bacterium]|nr:hypothetical protein [Patescibacteria group bacterium]
MKRLKVVFFCVIALTACVEENPGQTETDAGPALDGDIVADGDVTETDGSIVADGDVADADAEDSLYLGEVVDAAPVEEPETLPDNVECPGPLPAPILTFNNPDTCTVEFSRHFVRGARAARVSSHGSGEDAWIRHEDAEISERDPEYLALTFSPGEIPAGNRHLYYTGYRDAEARSDEDPMFWTHFGPERLSRLTLEALEYVGSYCDGIEPWADDCGCSLRVEVEIDYDEHDNPVTCRLSPGGDVLDWPVATFEGSEGETCYEHLQEPLETFAECGEEGCSCGIIVDGGYMFGSDFVRLLHMHSNLEGPLGQSRCFEANPDGNYRLAFDAEDFIRGFGEYGRFGRFSIYVNAPDECSDPEDDGRFWMPFGNNDLVPFHTYDMRQFAHCPWYDGNAGELLHDGPYGWCYTSVAVDVWHDPLAGRPMCRFVPAGNMGAYTLRMLD